MSEKLIIKSVESVVAQEVAEAKETKIQVLLGPDEGMPNFYTRLFTVEPGGRIPLHRHNIIEHQQLVLDGEMTMILETGDERTVKAGDVVYFAEKVAHGYENRGDVVARFVCIIPNTADVKTDWLED
jgi:quercetin dioxygenase-like cupin family protein